MINNLFHKTLSAALIGISLCVFASEAEAAHVKTASTGEKYICAESSWRIRDRFYKPIGKSLMPGECMEVFSSVKGEGKDPASIIVYTKKGEIAWLISSNDELSKLGLPNNPTCLEGMKPVGEATYE